MRGTPLVLKGISIGLLVLMPLLLLGHILGWAFFDPTQTHQCFHSDLAFQYLGYGYFRHSPWSFPIGEIQGYMHPLGSNVGYTDSIPLMAILFKIAEPLLPLDFHYFGIWFTLCFGLQVYFAWKLMGLIPAFDLSSRVVASLLLALSPILIHRVMHAALCAHFLILAALYLYKTKASVSQGYALATLLLLLSAWIHPYLVVIQVALWGGHLLEGMRSKGWRRLGRELSLLLLGPLMVLLSWYIIGYFSLPRMATASEGLGEYTFNLNGLFNSMGWGSLPGLPYKVLQYEGYAYLGAGIGGIAIWTFALFMRRKLMDRHDNGTPNLVPEKTLRAKRQRIWWIMVIALAFIALGPKPGIGEFVLFSYLSEVHNWSWLQAFRSTGRFIWPLWYTLAFFVIQTWSQVKLGKFQTPVLLLLLLVQAIDIWPLIQVKRLDARPSPELAFDAPNWASMIQHADSILFYPSFQTGYGANLAPLYIADLARQYRKPSTFGNAARANPYQMTRYQQALRMRLESGLLSPSTLYIMPPALAPDLDFTLADSQNAGVFLDDLLVMGKETKQNTIIKDISKSQTRQGLLPRSLNLFLRKYDTFLQVLVVHDDGMSNLGQENRSYLQGIGLHPEEVHVRGSYLAIVKAGHVLAEEWDNELKLYADFCRGDSLAGVHIPANLHIESAGHGKGWSSAVWVDGVRHAYRKRGFSVLIFDKRGVLVAEEHFDTYARPYRLE